MNMKTPIFYTAVAVLICFAQSRRAGGKLARYFGVGSAYATSTGDRIQTFGDGTFL